MADHRVSSAPGAGGWNPVRNVEAYPKSPSLKDSSSRRRGRYAFKEFRVHEGLERDFTHPASAGRFAGWRIAAIDPAGATAYVVRRRKGR